MIAFLKSDEIISCIELYDYKNTMFLVLEYMDGGSMNEIVTKGHNLISEDFCRYTLFKIAKGLQAMHERNILHRDIKSDNVLCSLDG